MTPEEMGEIEEAHRIDAVVCPHCSSVHIILSDEDGPVIQAIIPPDEVEKFCDAMLEAIGSSKRVRHDN